MFTISPSFIVFRDSVAYQPVFPDYKYNIIVRPYSKIRNMGYCYNYPLYKPTKTGITEKKSETLAISKVVGYTVQVCAKYQKAKCLRSADILLFLYTLENRYLPNSKIAESHGVLHLRSIVGSLIYPARISAVYTVRFPERLRY